MDAIQLEERRQSDSSIESVKDGKLPDCVASFKWPILSWFKASTGWNVRWSLQTTSLSCQALSTSHPSTNSYSFTSTIPKVCFSTLVVGSGRGLTFEYLQAGSTCTRSATFWSIRLASRSFQSIKVIQNNSTIDSLRHGWRKTPFFYWK